MDVDIYRFIKTANKNTDLHEDSYRDLIRAFDKSYIYLNKMDFGKSHHYSRSNEQFNLNPRRTVNLSYKNDRLIADINIGPDSLMAPSIKLEMLLAGSSGYTEYFMPFLLNNVFMNIKNPEFEKIHSVVLPKEADLSDFKRASDIYTPEISVI